MSHVLLLWINGSECPGARVWTLHTATINSRRAEGRERGGSNHYFLKNYPSLERSPKFIFLDDFLLHSNHGPSGNWERGMTNERYHISFNLFYCFTAPCGFPCTVLHMFCLTGGWKSSWGPASMGVVEEGLLLLPGAVFWSSLRHWVFALTSFLSYLMDETRLNPEWMQKALRDRMKCYVYVTQLWLDALNEPFNNNQVVGIWLVCILMICCKMTCNQIGC